MRSRYQVVAALWFLQIANYLDRTVISFAGPSMMKSLSIAPSTFGIILTSFAVGYVIAQIPGGLLADRWGAKLVLVSAPVLWAAIIGLTGLAASVSSLIVLRIFLGLTEGGANAAGYKIIGETFNTQERALVGGIWGTSFALAPAFAAPLVGILLISHSWQSVFVVMTVPPLLAAVINAIVIPRSRRTDNPYPAADLGKPSVRLPISRILRTPSLWLISLTYFFFNIGYAGYLGWMPSYLALQRHIDIKASGHVAGIPYLFAFLGLLVIGWMGSYRFQRHRPQLLAVAYGLASLSLVYAYTSSNLTSAVVGLSSAAFFLYGGITTWGAIVLDLAPASIRATYAGVVGTIGQIGAIAAPASIGYLVTASGNFATGFALMIAALGLAAVCVLSLARLTNNRAPASGHSDRASIRGA
jgi:sugar phosphate permease